jgi:hypothetical protein
LALAALKVIAPKSVRRSGVQRFDTQFDGASAIHSAAPVSGEGLRITRLKANGRARSVRSVSETVTRSELM